jgi:hypothetical protein
MKLEFKMFGALCEHEVFNINDVRATYEDFGDKFDRRPDKAEPYGCGDMRFTSKPATQDVLDKYKITLEDYNNICSMLEDKMSWGECGWCI